jgi:alginate O-acetyltransferase complex protein AlgI
MGMPFDSPLFLLIFLPAVLGAFALAPKVSRQGLLLAVSLVFYAMGDAASLVVFAVSVAGNMLLGLGIERSRGRARTLVTACGVAANLGLLAYAKYFTFAISQFSGLEGLKHLGPSSLPLGISFFTFSAVAYLVDIHRGTCPAQTNPIRFGLFMTFFAKITAGPIARFQDMFPGPDRVPGPGLEDVAEGLRRLALGLAKKTLVAGRLGPLADAAFTQPVGQLDMGTAWLGLVCYALQLYFDFSGYTDMALGLGRIFGYKLPENFNYPYISQSVREFWRRWHMTLSGWFRDYLYIPLGGGRVATWKVYRNLLVVFALCGLWHGAAWNFVVWGLWHGVFLVLERTAVGRMLDKAPRPVRHAYALLAVGLGWVFFRASSLGAAVDYLQAMVSFSFGGFAYTWMVLMNRQTLVVLAVAVIGCAPVLGPLKARLGRIGDLAQTVLPPALLAAALLAMAAGTHTPFIYAQF